MRDPSRLRLGWDGVGCAAAVVLSVHASLLVLVIYSAINLVLCQTFPVLIIFSFLYSYRTVCCLLLTAVVAVLTRYGHVICMPTPNTHFVDCCRCKNNFAELDLPGLFPGYSVVVISFSMALAAACVGSVFSLLCCSLEELVDFWF